MIRSSLALVRQRDVTLSDFVVWIGAGPSVRPRYKGRMWGLSPFLNISTSKFCTFWLRIVLRATAVRFSIISTSKTVRTCGAFAILTSKRASCHDFSCPIWPDGFAPPALASLLTYFLTFRTLEKQSVTRLWYLFAHLHLLSDSFYSLIFIFLLFSSLTLPTSAFPAVHIVGSLTSILLSTKHPLETRD